MAMLSKQTGQQDQIQRNLWTLTNQLSHKQIQLKFLIIHLALNLSNNTWTKKKFLLLTMISRSHKIMIPYSLWMHQFNKINLNPVVSLAMDRVNYLKEVTMWENQGIQPSQCVHNLIVYHLWLKHKSQHLNNKLIHSKITHHKINSLWMTINSSNKTHLIHLNNRMTFRSKIIIIRISIHSNNNLKMSNLQMIIVQIVVDLLAPHLAKTRHKKILPHPNRIIMIMKMIYLY